jgi:CubicO group peptidase (beta-lactamase class C family)
MPSKFKLSIILFLIIISASRANAANNRPFGDNDSISAKIDSIVGCWANDSTPGGVVGVIKDGEFIFKRSYGLMNMDYGLPNMETTVFNMGSMAKQFTAFCVLLLSEEEKLSLDDDIRKYLPDFPDYGDTVTIRHLLHHTSGIRSFDVLELVAGNLGYGMDKKDMYELIRRQKQLNFKPGKEFLYSNSGYFLLGEIVERISDKSLGQYTDEKILLPWE